VRPWLICSGVVISILLSSCMTPPIANPNGLSPDALTLEYVLDRGCFPYILGEKTENEAMRGIGLNQQAPRFQVFLPPGSPTWNGLYPGLSNVVVGRASCSVNMKRSNTAEYRAVTKAVLRRRFGPAVEQDALSGYKAVLPGQVTGCHHGVRYTFYENPRGTIFSVDLNRVDCTNESI